MSIPAIITNNDMRCTHRTGTIAMSYADLVWRLGKAPNKGDGEKTDVEWNVCRKDDISVHIGVWNYKNGPVYAGVTLEEIDQFSIWAETEEQKAFAKELFGDAVKF